MSPLLSLPSELRLRIYELIVESPGVVNISSYPVRVCEPPITQICRCLRLETLPVFYGKTVFLVQSLSLLWAFLTSLGPQRTKQLRDVRLQRGFWSWDRRWRYVESAAMSEAALKMEVYESKRREWVWTDKREFEEFWAEKVK